MNMRFRSSLLSILYWLFLSVLNAVCGVPASGDFQIDQVGPVTRVVDLAAYQKVAYVSVSTGQDQPANGSRVSPWKSLTYALSRIGDASTSSRYGILVAEGSYAQGTVRMKEYVDLFGGFSAKEWTRDIQNHRTVLDGMGVRRVVEGASNACLDGFIIIGGVSRSPGAGIRCWDASPVISNNVIAGNLVLEPENFDHTHMYQKGNHGGGIASLYNSVPVIRNNLIIDNRTGVGYGAGVVFYGLFRAAGVPEVRLEQNRLNGGAQAVLENNVIAGNIAGVTDLNRSRSSSGGGVACAVEARPVIRNNVVIHNQALGRSDAGGIYIEYFSYPLIEHNWILGNVCDDDGGGIYTTHQGQPLIRENFFAGNWTNGGGCGGVRLSKEGRAEVIGNIIVYNPGGGVMVVDSWIRLEGNIIMHNDPGSGFIYNQNFSYFQPSVIRNNLIRDNEKGAVTIMTDSGPPFIIEENNVNGNSGYPGNFDRDPTLPDNGIRGPVKSAVFNRMEHVSLIEPAKKLPVGIDLKGRVIRVGQQWGVIRENKNGKLLVWGNFWDPDMAKKEFEILPSFELNKGR